MRSNVEWREISAYNVMSFWTTKSVVLEYK